MRAVHMGGQTNARAFPPRAEKARPRRHGLTGLILILACMLFSTGCAHRGPAAETRLWARERAMELMREEVSWEKVLELHFQEPEDLKLFRVVAGEWEISGGRLSASGGDRNRAILLAKCFDGPVRVEFEATNYSSGGLIGDITLLLGAAPDETFFRSGYSLTTGSYWNTCTSFYRGGRIFANTSYSPVASGRKNSVRVDFVRGHLRYEMNGELLLEALDADPLELSGWIGLRTWATLMHVHSFKVYRGVLR